MKPPLLVALALVSLCTTPALADSVAAPTLPLGVTIYASASATTTDVDASFTATKTAKTAAAGAAVLAAAKADAGPATIEDQGVAQTMMGGSVETVKVSGGPADVKAARSKLQKDGFSATSIAMVARDLPALQAEAYRKATRAARALAEAAAAADGRHVGRLVNIAPSPMAMLGGLTDMLDKLPQMQAVMAEGTAASASATASGYYTFELLP